MEEHNSVSTPGSDCSKRSQWSREDTATASPKLFMLSLKNMSPGDDIKKNKNVSAPEITEALKALTLSSREKFRAEIFAEKCEHGFLQETLLPPSRDKLLSQQI